MDIYISDRSVTKGQQQKHSTVETLFPRRSPFILFYPNFSFLAACTTQTPSTLTPADVLEEAQAMLICLHPTRHVCHFSEFLLAVHASPLCVEEKHTLQLPIGFMLQSVVILEGERERGIEREREREAEREAEREIKSKERNMHYSQSKTSVSPEKERKTQTATTEHN